MEADASVPEWRREARRAMRARDKPAFAAGLFFLLATSAVFLAVVAPHFSPVVPVVFAYLLLVAIAALLSTTLSDPGRIPRYLDHDAISPNTDTTNTTNANNENNNNDDSNGAKSDTVIPLDYPFPANVAYLTPKTVMINEHEVQLKFCMTCEVYRPPRSSHCGICDACIELHDHHCPWVLNCVGRRNYATFLTFVLTVAVMCIYVFSFSLLRLIASASSLPPSSDLAFFEAVKQEPTCAVLLVLTFIFFWSTGSLGAYHIMLVLRNRTTHEHVPPSTL